VVKAVAATATVPIHIELVRAIEVTINTSLNFGMLALTNDRTGQATLDPLSDKLFIAGQSSIALAAGTPRAGRVQIKGAPIPVAVSFENEVVQLTNGTTSLTVSSFNFISNNVGSQVTVTPPETNSEVTLSVGATIKAKQGQLTGTYIGSNRIFANYQ
jgi:hypothetical protein